MVGKSGPFRIIGECLVVTEDDLTPPIRRFFCAQYMTCLGLAAALDWDNFTCQDCPGAIDKSLLEQALIRLEGDKLAKQLCKELISERQ